MDHTDRLSIAKGRYGCYKRLAICLLNAGLAACFELEDLRSWTVVSGGAPVSDPTWSPDGGRIAFAQKPAMSGATETPSGIPETMRFPPFHQWKR